MGQGLLLLLMLDCLMEPSPSDARQRPGSEVDRFEGYELAQRHGVDDARGPAEGELRQLLKDGKVR